MTGGRVDPDIEEIARRYLRCSADLSRSEQDEDAAWGPERNPDEAAYDEVRHAIRQGPAARAWALVSTVIRFAPDDRLEVEAAGPLEDLVRLRGAELVREVEAEAACDARFR